jgi:copper chaperone CopZ
MSHTRLTVAGMTCEACVAAVREALELPGVRRVDVSLGPGVVEVDHAPGISVGVMVAAVTDTGYDVRDARSE